MCDPLVFAYTDRMLNTKQRLLKNQTISGNTTARSRSGFAKVAGESIPALRFPNAWAGSRKTLTGMGNKREEKVVVDTAPRWAPCDRKRNRKLWHNSH